MQFLNLELNYFEHPKTIRLIGLLGRGAEVLPIKLWAYCGKFRPESGRLTDHSAQEIESIVGWWGTQGRLMEVLLQLGFVERDGEGFKVHDWLETQGHLAMFKERAKKGAAARWGRDATSNATSNAQASVKQCPNQPTNQPTKRAPAAVEVVESELPEKLRESKFVEALKTWLEYKKERRESYKPIGFKAFVSKLETLGPAAATKALNHSMAQNWAGCFEPKAANGKPIETFDRTAHVSKLDADTQRRQAEIKEQQRRKALIDNALAEIGADSTASALELFRQEEPTARVVDAASNRFRDWYYTKFLADKGLL